MGAIEEAGKVGSTAVESMKSTPLAIALLIVNACFIGFVAYVLSIVGQNAAERSQSQTQLIEKLVTECRQVSKPPTP
jgi:hypothetical protein